MQQYSLNYKFKVTWGSIVQIQRKKRPLVTELHDEVFEANVVLSSSLKCIKKKRYIDLKKIQTLQHHDLGLPPYRTVEKPVFVV